MNARRRIEEGSHTHDTATASDFSGWLASVLRLPLVLNSSTTRSSSDDSEIRYVLPVFCMTSRFHVSRHTRRVSELEHPVCKKPVRLCHHLFPKVQFSSRTSGSRNSDRNKRGLEGARFALLVNHCNHRNKKQAMSLRMSGMCRPIWNISEWHFKDEILQTINCKVQSDRRKMQNLKKKNTK